MTWAEVINGSKSLYEERQVGTGHENHPNVEWSGGLEVVGNGF